MSVRTNYYTAFTLHLATAIAYVTVPSFAWTLRGWYFPVGVFTLPRKTLRQLR